MTDGKFRIEPLNRQTREQYLDLCQFCFSMSEESRSRYFTEEHEFAHSLGAFDGDRLACGMWYWDYEMRVRDRFVPMGGVAAVATWPEYRNRGLVRQLMGGLQEMMREEGRPISVLAPFKWSFYYDLGWAPTFDTLRVFLEPEKIRSFDTSDHEIREVDGPGAWQTFEQLHAQYGSRYNGTVCRGERYWRIRYFQRTEATIQSYLILRGGEPRGFLIGYQANPTASNPREFRVLQAVWLDGRAQRALFGLLRSLRDQLKRVEFFLPPDTRLFPLLDNPLTEVQLMPKMMTKIIDVPAALERITYPRDLEGTLNIEVQPEATSPWNTGTYHLQFEAGGVSVQRRSTSSEALVISIQQLSELYMGYRTARDLVSAGELDSLGDQLEILERAFPRHPTYIDDWF